jgi:transcriptional regulator with XRE-family HTH domain
MYPKEMIQSLVALGMSQKDIAHAIGRTPVAVNRIATGKQQRVTSTTLAALQRLYAERKAARIAELQTQIDALQNS